MSRVLALVLAVLVSLALVLGACAKPAQAPTSAAADFYKGKTMDLTLIQEPGTVADLTGRLLVSYLKKYADITAVVTTRRAAGGTEGIMWVQKANPDGLTVGITMLGTLTLNKINAVAGTDYEVEKFNYLLGVGEVRRFFFVSAKGPYQNLSALQAAKNIKLAGTSLGGGISTATVAGAFLADLDAKVVTGFNSTAATLSVEQGETAGFAMTAGEVLDLSKAGRVKVLFVLDRERDPIFPDVPAITELVNVQGEKKDLVELFHEMRSGAGVFTSPGVPKDRVDYLSGVFQKITADTQFRSEENKVWGFDVKVYQSGKELEQTILKLMKLGNDLNPLLKRLFATYTIKK